MKRTSTRLLAILIALAFAGLSVSAQENGQTPPEPGETQATQDQPAQDQPAQQQGQQQDGPAQQQEEEQGPGYSNTVPSGVDGHVILAASGTMGWNFLESGGEGVYAKPTLSRIYFEIGGEYYLDLSNLDTAQFPIDIRDGNGNVIISQRDVETPRIEGANVSVSDDGIRFTLSEALAERISMFRAAPYPQMVVFVSPVEPEPQPAQEGQGDGQEGDTTSGEGGAGAENEG